MTTPQLDPIAGLLPDEVRGACREILNTVSTSDAFIVGAIIAQLQEWNCGVSWMNGSKLWLVCRYILGNERDGFTHEEKSLQVCFLRTAQALGRWHPKPKEPKLTLEQRVSNMENWIELHKHQFPQLR